MKNSELIYTGHDLIAKYLDPKFQDGNYGDNSEPACIMALCFGLPFTVLSNASGRAIARKEYALEISTPAGKVSLKNQDLGKGIFGKFYASGAMIGEDITIENLNSIILSLGKANSTYKWDYIVLSRNNEIYEISSKAGNGGCDFTHMSHNRSTTLSEVDGDRLAPVLSEKLKTILGIDISTTTELLNSPIFHMAQGSYFTPARGINKNPDKHASHWGFSHFRNGMFALVVVPLDDAVTVNDVFNSKTLRITRPGTKRKRTKTFNGMECASFSIRRKGLPFWTNLMDLLDQAILIDSKTVETKSLAA